MITAAASAAQNLVTAANRAGIHVDDLVFEPLACADATLDSDERELGVCLIDIGAGSTEVVVFYEGAVAHTGVIPIGGGVPGVSAEEMVASVQRRLDLEGTTGSPGGFSCA